MSFASDLEFDFVDDELVDSLDFLTDLFGPIEVPTVFFVVSSLTTDFLTAGSGLTDFVAPPSVRELGELRTFTGCEEESTLDFPGLAVTAVAPFFGETILTGVGLAVVV